MEAGALLQQPCLFHHLSQDRGKPRSVSQREKGLGEPLAAGDKQPKTPWRASTLGLAAAPAEQPGLRVNSSS